MLKFATAKYAEFYFLLFILFLSSCSIEKRVYTSGYHIEWNSKNEATKKNVSIHSTQKEKQESDQNFTEVSSKNSSSENFTDSTCVSTCQNPVAFPRIATVNYSQHKTQNELDGFTTKAVVINQRDEKVTACNQHYVRHGLNTNHWTVAGFIVFLIVSLIIYLIQWKLELLYPALSSGLALLFAILIFLTVVILLAWISNGFSFK